jgi:hypothetical protein
MRPAITPLWLDCTIALLLGVGAAIGGLSYWKRATVNGQPFYYQNYFEPAVMIACGRGFVVARPQVPAMVPFLRRDTNQFSCDAIPADAPLGTEDLFQLGSWRYLMLAVGWTWRLFGVSWNALGPLFAVLFGATIAVLYGVFRLGMSAMLAAAGAVALSFSAMHLRYLLVLRDYTKAPFTLTLILLVGLLVSGRATWQRVLWIAAGYGAILGVGYGFRTDFLSDVPPFFIALLLFLEGSVLRNLRLKAAAAALCLVVFFVTGWPVISSLNRARPGCEWHVVLMGFAHSFLPAMGVEAAPYEVNREYLDEYAYANVTSYAARTHPGISHIEYCGVDYGVATRAYLAEAVRRFPADVIVRAYASVRRIVELPFTDRANEDVADQVAHNRAYGLGLPIVVAAVLLAMAANLRIGLFLLFFVLYFGGVPATQFDARHFFHLEFITVWAIGFLLQRAIDHVPSAVRDRTWPVTIASLGRSAAVLTGCIAALAALLWIARLYQQPAARAFFSDYLAAGREELPMPHGHAAEAPPPIRVSPHTDPETADFVVVDLDASRCGERAAVGFHYDDPMRQQFSRVFEVGKDSSPGGLTHIFMPIYERFGRIEFRDSPPGCVQGVFRVRDPSRFSMLLEVMLRPGWRRDPLYQRFRTPDGPRAGAND